MRMTRWEYLRSVQKIHPKGNQKRLPPSRQPKKVAKKKDWQWEDNYCQAHTKSEARAQFKELLGLDRLPVGAKVNLLR